MNDGYTPGDRQAVAFPPAAALAYPPMRAAPPAATPTKIVAASITIPADPANITVSVHPDNAQGFLTISQEGFSQVLMSKAAIKPLIATLTTALSLTEG